MQAAHNQGNNILPAGCYTAGSACRILNIQVDATNERAYISGNTILVKLLCFIISLSKNIKLIKTNSIPDRESIIFLITTGSTACLNQLYTSIKRTRAGKEKNKPIKIITIKSGNALIIAAQCTVFTNPVINTSSTGANTMVVNHTLTA